MILSAAGNGLLTMTFPPQRMFRIDAKYGNGGYKRYLLIINIPILCNPDRVNEES
jgi:hypothetical protein